MTNQLIAWHCVRQILMKLSNDEEKVTNGEKSEVQQCVRREQKDLPGTDSAIRLKLERASFTLGDPSTPFSPQTG